MLALLIYIYLPSYPHPKNTCSLCFVHTSVTQYCTRDRKTLFRNRFAIENRSGWVSWLRYVCKCWSITAVHVSNTWFKLPTCCNPTSYMCSSLQRSLHGIFKNHEYHSIMGSFLWKQELAHNEFECIICSIILKTYPSWNRWMDLLWCAILWWLAHVPGPSVEDYNSNSTTNACQWIHSDDHHWQFQIHTKFTVLVVIRLNDWNDFCDEWLMQWTWQAWCCMKRQKSPCPAQRHRLTLS